jgi:hypothetical protein
MKWVTREYVHVDRTACPWLIKRFVDKEAKFLFVAVDRIEDVVKKEKAIPYDAPNVELGHHGDKCSFDAIMEKYGIKDSALLGLAEIVRAADTGRPELSPQAAGLDAMMTGISAASRDDFDAIEKASSVYDALYDYCRVEVISKKYKAEIEKMGKPQRRKFLKEKLKEG